jgi:hypothetical protein
MTDKEFTKARLFIIRGALAAGVDVADPDKIIRWLVENPLPEDFEDLTDVQNEEEKQARITKLRSDLAKLEAPTKGAEV